MTDEQSRTAANDRERSPDHEYTLSVEQVADLYAKAGHPRTIRAIQKYCAVSKLDCHKVDTEQGERYIVAPYSVARHLAYIDEVRTVANGRAPENQDELHGEQSRTTANDHEQSRTVATVRGYDVRYMERLEGENEFLRGQIGVKDDQIKDLTERARETNHLIAGLQKMLTPLLGRPDESQANPR